MLIKKYNSRGKTWQSKKKQGEKELDGYGIIYVSGAIDEGTSEEIFKKLSNIILKGRR